MHGGDITDKVECYVENEITHVLNCDQRGNHQKWARLQYRLQTKEDPYAIRRLIATILKKLLEKVRGGS